MVNRKTREVIEISIKKVENMDILFENDTVWDELSCLMLTTLPIQKYLKNCWMS